MHPEFFNYPGSAFAGANLTGAHLAISGFGAWVKNLWLLSFGGRGIFFHNPLLLVGAAIAASAVIYEKEIKWKWYGVFTLVAAVAVALYYSLTGTPAGGGDAYSVRWFAIFIPLFFPFILRWLVRGGWRWRRVLAYSLAALTMAVNILAMGSFYGPEARREGYSAASVYHAFPARAAKQWEFWRKILFDRGENK